MKKFLVSIVAVLLAAPSFAQFSSGGFELDNESVYYGVRLGITSATLAGVLGLRVSSTTPVFLESGLYYTERGAKNIGYNNFEIPLLIKYGIQTSDDIAILPFIGPYFSYAFSGKTKILGDDGKKVKVGLKRANMGFKIGCGAEYNKLYLEIGYQLGVTNVSKDDDLSLHSSALFANFGVNF